MVNLLPQDLQRQVHREYKLRFFTLLLLFFIFAIVVGIVALVPYASSFGFKYASLKQSETQTTEETASTTPEVTASVNLQTFKSSLIVLDPKKNTATSSILVSDLVLLLTEQKPKEVNLTSFTFTKDGETRRRLVVSGISSSREGLVTFSKKLSENKLFSVVDLPISNLSKKTNIDFSITLTIGK